MRFLSNMYLRPGNLWKSFRIMEEISVNKSGYLVNDYQDTGRELTGVLAQADSYMADRVKHLWDQSKHSLTHTLVNERRVKVNKGDLLTTGEKAYLVLTYDDIGALGIAGLIYLEERNDVK